MLTVNPDLSTQFSHNNNYRLMTLFIFQIQVYPNLAQQSTLFSHRVLTNNIVYETGVQDDMT